MKSSVSIIIVNYNGKKYLKPCFDSLFKMDKGNFSLEIIMVDNLSKDDSINFVKKKFPEIKIIENDTNNYTKALNLGIKKSQGDYIAILNNDTTVEKRWLNKLIEVINQDERIGVVQSKILFSDGKTINSIGVEEIENLYFKDIAFGQEDIGEYENVKEIDYFSGGSALLRKACVKNVGPFDEDFMFYMEDVDYSIRCRKNGWKIFYCPKSIAYHTFHGSASHEFCHYFCSRNRLLFIGKHFPLKLLESIKTSQFCNRNQYDEMSYSFIQAIAKMTENNDPEISREALSKLKDAAIGLFEERKGYNFLDYVLAHNLILPTASQRLINNFKRKLQKTPVLGPSSKWAMSIVKLLIGKKTGERR